MGKGARRRAMRAKRTSRSVLPQREIWVLPLVDTLPLPDEGHRSTFHEADCDPASGCHEGELCGGTHLCFDHDDQPDGGAFARGTEAASRRVALLTGEPGSHSELPPEPSRTTVITVTTALSEEGTEPFERAFGMAQRYVNAMRIASNATIPPLTFERLAGVSFRLRLEDGSLRPYELSPHFPNTLMRKALTLDQLEQVDDWFLASVQSHPTELFRDLKLRALTARDTGDYMVAITMSATAAEVLIEQTARVLIWERVNSGYADDWTRIPKTVDKMYPKDWIDNVLAKALGGDWGKDGEISSWDHDTRSVRNQVMHEGLRASPEQANNAVEGLFALESFLCDRIFACAQKFPSTAVNTLGRAGFTRRGGSVADYDLLGGAGAITAHGFAREFREWDGPAVRQKSTTSE